MVWHVCWTTAPGAMACPMRLAALGPLTAPVWWATRPDATAIILRQSQACSGLIRRAAFVISTRLSSALSPFTRGTLATRSAVGAGSWLYHTSEVYRVTSWPWRRPQGLVRPFERGQCPHKDPPATLKPRQRHPTGGNNVGGRGLMPHYQVRGVPYGDPVIAKSHHPRRPLRDHLETDLLA